MTPLWFCCHSSAYLSLKPNWVQMILSAEERWDVIMALCSFSLKSAISAALRKPWSKVASRLCQDKYKKDLLLG